MRFAHVMRLFCFSVIIFLSYQFGVYTFFSLISRVCKLLIQLEVARGMLQKNEH